MDDIVMDWQRERRAPLTIKEALSDLRAKQADPTIEVVLTTAVMIEILETLVDLRRT